MYTNDWSVRRSPPPAKEKSSGTKCARSGPRPGQAAPAMRNTTRSGGTPRRCRRSRGRIHRKHPTHRDEHGSPLPRDGPFKIDPPRSPPRSRREPTGSPGDAPRAPRHHAPAQQLGGVAVAGGGGVGQRGGLAISTGRLRPRRGSIAFRKSNKAVIKCLKPLGIHLFTFAGGYR